MFKKSLQYFSDFEFVQHHFAKVIEDGQQCLTKTLTAVVDKVLQPVKAREKVPVVFQLRFLIISDLFLAICVQRDI